MNERTARPKAYKKLKAWEEAHHFAMLVYGQTKQFPKEELYGITSQLRRSALSVPTNLVEGQASQSRKDFRNFVNISRRSLAESEYLLEVAHELGYLTDRVYQELEKQREKAGYLLYRLFSSL